jgi:hypothetical protein
MPIYNLTWEKIEELKKQKDDKESEHEEIKAKSPENMWYEELELLQSKYDKWLKIKAQSEDSTLTKKVKKNKK